VGRRKEQRSRTERPMPACHSLSPLPTLEGGFFYERLREWRRVRSVGGRTLLA
jgi:hypothetical protein